MSVELLLNNSVQMEMIDIYTKELFQNDDDDFSLFLATEKEKVLNRIKIDSGFYKGKEIQPARNYFRGFSDAQTYTIKKKYVSFLSHQINTNDTITPITKEYIISKIEVTNSQLRKLFRKFERKKEKYGIK
jgi:hypothetical protein